MSGDEVLVLLLTLPLSIWGWYVWYRDLRDVRPLGRRMSQHRLALRYLPVVSALVIFIMLRTTASFDVQESLIYIPFYVILGLAWLAGGREVFHYLFDLSWRDDVLEMENPAATWTLIGGLLGITAIYAGANVGDGPGWWVVLFAGGVGLVAWLSLLALLNLCTGVMEKITIGRSLPCAIRTGAYLLASGIMAGRGAAGDWTSATATLIEFGDAWPLLLLLLVAIVIERTSTAADGSETGAQLARLWAVFFLVLSVVYLLLSPVLPQNPIYTLGLAGF